MGAAAHRPLAGCQRQRRRGERHGQPRVDVVARRASTALRTQRTEGDGITPAAAAGERRRGRIAGGHTSLLQRCAGLPASGNPESSFRYWRCARRRQHSRLSYASAAGKTAA